MYPASGKLILGFHGCDEAVGLNIISGKDNLRPRENDYTFNQTLTAGGPPLHLE